MFQIFLFWLNDWIIFDKFVPVLVLYQGKVCQEDVPLEDDFGSPHAHDSHLEVEWQQVEQAHVDDPVAGYIYIDTLVLDTKSFDHAF